MAKIFFNNERYYRLLIHDIISNIDAIITDTIEDNNDPHDHYRILFDLRYAFPVITGYAEHTITDNKHSHSIVIPDLFCKQCLTLLAILANDNEIIQSTVVIESNETSFIVLLYFGMSENENNMISHLRIPKRLI